MVAMNGIACALADFPLELPTGEESVPKARDWVRHRFRGMRLSLIHDACLITSEFVTNAVRHASRVRYPRVYVLVYIHRLGPVIEVRDNAGELPPVLRKSTCVDETFALVDPVTGDGCGRGLQLVDAIAAQWGWQPIPETGGKTVYAVLAT
jgi:anti-sigma regulatory factor (Ser/Thr protein kinase)